MTNETTKKPIGDSSIARMAGNIAAGFVSHYSASVITTLQLELVAYNSVRLARLIVAELEAETEQPAEVR